MGFLGAFQDIIDSKLRTPQENQWEVIAYYVAGTVKGEKEKRVRAGMDDYVSKPLVEEDIQQVFDSFT